MASPMPAGGFCEQFLRGKWVPTPLSRKIDDFCATLNNPMEPWYEIMKDRDHEKCPLTVGSKMYLREKAIDFSKMYFPPNFAGRFLKIQEKIFF
jgi:hypothetical protein